MRTTPLLMTLFLAAGVALAGACSDAGTPKQAASTTESATVSPPPAAKAPDADVVATFGDQVLTASELAKMTPPKASEATIRKIIDTWAETALVASKARAAGFDKTTDARVKTDAALADAFVRSQFETEARKQINDSQLTAYFGERRRARVIRIDDAKQANAVHKQLADALKATPKQAARIFVDFQKRHSSTFSRANERALFDRQGRDATGDAVVQPRIAAAAFAIQESNTITPPVSMPEGGAVIVQLVAKKDAIPLASVPPPVRERAIAALARKHVADSRRLLIARLKSDSPIQVNAEPITELVNSGAGTKMTRFRKFNPKAFRQAPSDMKRVNAIAPEKKVRGYTTEEMREMMHKNMPDGAQK